MKVFLVLVLLAWLHSLCSASPDVQEFLLDDSATSATVTRYEVGLLVELRAELADAAEAVERLRSSDKSERIRRESVFLVIDDRASAGEKIKVVSMLSAFDCMLPQPDLFSRYLILLDDHGGCVGLLPMQNEFLASYHEVYDSPKESYLRMRSNILVDDLATRLPAPLSDIIGEAQPSLILDSQPAGPPPLHEFQRFLDRVAPESLPPGKHRVECSAIISLGGIAEVYVGPDNRLVVVFIFARGRGDNVVGYAFSSVPFGPDEVSRKPSGEFLLAPRDFREIRETGIESYISDRCYRVYRNQD